MDPFKQAGSPHDNKDAPALQGRFGHEQGFPRVVAICHFEPRTLGREISQLRVGRFLLAKSARLAPWA
jgi:hypothetical protein